MEKEYFTTKEIVRDCLVKNEELRDKDNLLIVEVLKKLEGNKINSMTALELLENIKNDIYGAFESITRARRKHQEKNEDLRGKTWEQRQAYQHSVWKQLTLWDLLNQGE